MKYYDEIWNIMYEDYRLDPAMDMEDFIYEIERCRLSNLSYFFFGNQRPHKEETVFQIYPDKENTSSKLYPLVDGPEIIYNDLVTELITFKQKYIKPEALTDIYKINKKFLTIPWKNVYSILILNLLDGLYFEPIFFVPDARPFTIQKLPVCIDMHPQICTENLFAPLRPDTTIAISLPIPFQPELKNKILQSKYAETVDSFTQGNGNFAEIVSDGFCIHNAPFYVPGYGEFLASKIYAKYPYRFVFFPQTVEEERHMQELLSDNINCPKPLFIPQRPTNCRWQLEGALYHELIKN